MKPRRSFCLIAVLVLGTSLTYGYLRQSSATPQTKVVDAFYEKGFSDFGAYKYLKELTSTIGARLSGSPAAAKAVKWGELQLKEMNLDRVWLQPCMVPHWERGKVEQFIATTATGQKIELTGTAIGMSVGTPESGIEAEVIQVNSLDEAKSLGEAAKGKIVFFNGRMDHQKRETFDAYGPAVSQRSQGADVASKLGAVAIIIRSVSTANDDEPHTGALRYSGDVPKIPAGAIGMTSADRLVTALKRGPVKLSMRLSCIQHPDAPSHNVIGEIKGTEFPEEVVVIGGHLDSWDKGTGAHDNGAGISHVLDTMKMIKQLGWKPKRTLRVVLFMNEENGGRGSDAYFNFAKTSGEKHIASIETDAGGFAPRGFSCSLKPEDAPKLTRWVDALRGLKAGDIRYGGGGGADTGELAQLGTLLFGLLPENHRYFDYHHANSDTLDKVNPRELQMGACAVASLAWFLCEEGVPPAK